MYSRLLLSRPRLSRITAYLEVKIWSMLKHENLTTGNNILWKRGEITHKEQFLLFSTIFSQYFQYIFDLTSQITYIFANVVVHFFLNSANLICRGKDISKYFRASIVVRDNESRLYLKIP